METLRPSAKVQMARAPEAASTTRSEIEPAHKPKSVRKALSSRDCLIFNRTPVYPECRVRRHIAVSFVWRFGT